MTCLFSGQNAQNLECSQDFKHQKIIILDCTAQHYKQDEGEEDENSKERCWYLYLYGLVLLPLSLDFDQLVGPILQKCHALAKTNPTQEDFNKSFTKEGDEEGSAMKEHSLHSSNCPRLNFLMKFSVLSKMQNVTEQISKSAGKLFLFASSPFCFTSAQWPAFKWVHRGGFQGAHREFK